MKVIYLFDNESYNEPGEKFQFLKKVLLDKTHPNYPFELIDENVTGNIHRCYLSPLKKGSDVLNETVTIEQIEHHLEDNGIKIHKIVKDKNDTYILHIEI